MPQRYKARKTEVEAMRLEVGNAAAVADWCNGVLVEEIGLDDEKYVGINYISSTGEMDRISEGFWLIRNTNGKFHSVPNEQFLDEFKEI